MRKDVIASDAVRSGMVRPGQKLSFKNHRSSISFGADRTLVYVCTNIQLLSLNDALHGR